METKIPEVHKKSWGYEEWIANTDKYCGKRLVLKKGKRCSVHYHKNKDETFYIEEGRVLMEVGGEEQVMLPGQLVPILPGVRHRFSGLEDSVIFESSTHHEESDSYRVEPSGDVPEEIMKRYQTK
jgi:mannose-6-phosphate isomerase-like protein (cupin superfamily)